MKIVQIEDFFHPDAGYQVNVLSKVLARRGHDVTVVCSGDLDRFPKSLTSFFGIDDIEARDELYTKHSGVKVIRVPSKGYYSGRTFYGSELDETIKSLNPELLFVHGNDSIPGMRFTSRAASLPFPVVFDSHMLSIAAHNRLAGLYRAFYRNTCASKINRLGLKVVRVQDDPYVISELGIKPEHAPYIGFGSDLNLFAPDASARAAFRAELGIGDNTPVVLYAGKLDESKGGMLLAEAVRKRLDGDPVVVIAGSATGENASELEAALQNSENRIIRLETQKYPHLPRLYQMADLALYPAQCSLSFLDAQACGLPVIVDDSTPVNIERVSHENGFLFKRGSAEELRERISEFLGMDPERRSVLSRNARAYISENFSYEDIAKLYEELFESVIVNFNNERK